MPRRPETLLPELQNLLLKRPAHVAEAIRRVAADVRPCVQLETTRVTSTPQRGSWLDRLTRKSPPHPKLSVLTSKFGGLPYAESADELDGAMFLGQINFAEAYAALTLEDFPIPAGMPGSGILAFDIPDDEAGRTRWYPEPSESKAARLDGCGQVAKYEASIRFRGSWSLRGLEWFDAVPKEDDELWNYLNDLEIDGIDSESPGHKLFGHANEALNEHYGLRPVSDRSDDIRDYALIWRIDYDNQAGFAWGTNWLYVVIHKDDLARGAFENAIVTGANA
jgi:hypothetical protein